MQSMRLMMLLLLLSVVTLVTLLTWKKGESNPGPGLWLADLTSASIAVEASRDQVERTAPSATPCHRQSSSQNAIGRAKLIAVSDFSGKIRSRQTLRPLPAWSPTISVAHLSHFRCSNGRSRPKNCRCGFSKPAIGRRYRSRCQVWPTSGLCTYRTSENSTCWRATW